MKRKRLNHVGDAIIGILTGYQVVLNFDLFDKNGPGTYVLDLFGRTLTFQGRDIPPFPIFSNIQDWFDRELRRNRIDPAFITTARVVVDVGNRTDLRPYTYEKRVWGLFKRTIVVTSHAYATRIEVDVKTDEKDYSRTGSGAVWN